MTTSPFNAPPELAKTAQHIANCQSKLPADRVTTAANIVHKQKELHPLTKPCKHCGATLLTTRGFIHQSKHPELAQLSFTCDCPQACAEDAAERAQAEALNREEAEQAKQRAARQRMQRSGIPERSEHLTWHDYHTNTPQQNTAKTAAQNFARAYLANPDTKGLLIVGNVGTGKSYLSSITCRAIQRNSKCKLLWRSMNDILSDFKSSYNKKATSDEEEILKRYIDAPLLVIDDLGKERVTEWSQPLLFSLINKRSEKRNRPIIVTTNYGGAALIDRLTPVNGDPVTAQAIVDRIKGSCIQITLTGDSFRKGELAQ